MNRENLQHALNVCALLDYEAQRIQYEKEQEEKEEEARKVRDAADETEAAAAAEEVKAGTESKLNTLRGDSTGSAIGNAPKGSGTNSGRGKGEVAGSSLMRNGILAIAEESLAAGAVAAIAMPLALRGLRKITRRS